MQNELFINYSSLYRNINEFVYVWETTCVEVDELMLFKSKTILVLEWI